MQDTVSTHDHIRATAVSGTEVFNVDGENVGKIEDVMLSKTTGRAVYAILSFGGFLGIGEKYHPLPWQSLSFSDDRGGYVISVSREQLEGAPNFERDAEPNWNDPEFGGALSRYYGYPML